MFLPYKVASGGEGTCACGCMKYLLVFADGWARLDDIMLRLPSDRELSSRYAFNDDKFVGDSSSSGRSLSEAFNAFDALTRPFYQSARYDLSKRSVRPGDVLSDAAARSQIPQTIVRNGGAPIGRNPTSRRTAAATTDNGLPVYGSGAPMDLQRAIDVAHDRGVARACGSERQHTCMVMCRVAWFLCRATTFLL